MHLPTTESAVQAYHLVTGLIFTDINSAREATLKVLNNHLPSAALCAIQEFGHLVDNYAAPYTSSIGITPALAGAGLLALGAVGCAHKRRHVIGAACLLSAIALTKNPVEIATVSAVLFTGVTARITASMCSRIASSCEKKSRSSTSGLEPHEKPQTNNSNTTATTTVR